MNFKTTSKLLEALHPFIENAEIFVPSENSDRKKQRSKSDIIMIDERNNFGFEVCDNEIIVFCFTSCQHFKNYNAAISEDANNYIKRAEGFLLDLFQHQVRHIACFKGKSLSSEKYYILYCDGREDCCIRNTWFGFSKFINPFGKKTIRSTTWKYDALKGRFTTCQTKKPDPDAIKVIYVNDHCYIEIFNRHHAYTYNIMELEFDDYFGMYYWVPATGVVSSGFYDTKESAVQNAMETLKHRGCD